MLYHVASDFAMPLPPFKLVILQAVTLLSISVTDSGNIKLFWSSPEGAKVAGYIVLWGTESGKYTSSLDVGPVREAIFTGLSKGRVYYFVVGAYYNPKKEPLALSGEIAYKVP